MFICICFRYHLQVRQYFESLPGDKVPEINTPGEQYREQQLSYQWPKQDLALNYCNHIEPQNRASYEDFVAGRNEIALDIAYIKDISSGGPVACINCDDDIEQGDLAVIAPKFKDDVSTQGIYIIQISNTYSTTHAYKYKWSRTTDFAQS